MKAVVLEIRNKYVAAMSDDGRIIRCKNQNYEIGQTITVEETNKKLTKRLISRVACAAACIALVSVSAWAYFTPYTYVSLDVNPSVEYKLNRFDMVLDYSALNDDGQKILNTLELKNKNINQALKETVQKIADEGYFKDTKDAGAVIAISCPDDKKSDEMAKEAEIEVDKAVREKGIDAYIEAESVGFERVQQAKELNVTPGKLNLVQKLQKSNPNEQIDEKYWLTQPVKNIMAKIKENVQAKIKEKNSYVNKKDTDTNNDDAVSDTNNKKGKNNNSITNRAAVGVENGKSDAEPVVNRVETKEREQAQIGDNNNGDNSNKSDLSGSSQVSDNSKGYSAGTNSNTKNK